MHAEFRRERAINGRDQRGGGGGQNSPPPPPPNGFKTLKKPNGIRVNPLQAQQLLEKLGELGEGGGGGGGGRQMTTIGKLKVCGRPAADSKSAASTVPE